MSQITTSLASRNVPRYTSYPTAPHFHTGIDGNVYAGWLRDLPEEADLSLYIHVPYCREICHYCGCNTKATHQDAPLFAYGETLLREIAMVGELIGTRRRVVHIHWGGGTPSMLPAKALVDIRQMLDRYFAMAPTLEHAIELDPRLVSKPLAETLAKIGITRASLGVQDVDLQVQEAIGRVQSYECVQNASTWLREVGITSLNFDLMYGLPFQTDDTIRDTVAKTLALKPSRIALFGYAHVPWMKKHQRLIDENALPDAARRVELAAVAHQALTEGGYVAVGMDHFALPDDDMAVALKQGELHRNFQGYTTDTAEDLIGFGVSSIGHLQQGYAQNASDVGTWRREIEAGRLPIARGVALDTDDRARGKIIERLMTNYAVDLAPIAERYGLPLASFDESVAKLAELVEDGLCDIDGSKIVLREAGYPYVRIAAAAFDTYLGKAPTSAGHAPRHSMAV